MQSNERIYLQPKSWLMNAINDTIELQKGKVLLANAMEGRLDFSIVMYRKKWEVHFTVSDMDCNRCRVSLDITGDIFQKEQQIQKQFALLESLMVNQVTTNTSH